MKFVDFINMAIPKMLERIKTTFYSQQIDVFDYSEPYTPIFLFKKSRFMNEDEGFEEQTYFEDKLENLRLFDFTGYGPDPEYFHQKLKSLRWSYESIN